MVALVLYIQTISRNFQGKVKVRFKKNYSFSTLDTRNFKEF